MSGAGKVWLSGGIDSDDLTSVPGRKSSERRGWMFGPNLMGWV